MLAPTHAVRPRPEGRAAHAPSAAHRFAREDRGAATIYFLVLSLLLFGILGVLIDSSRAYVAHTNMQDYIDDWVLAAANELDGEPDAIERAEQVLNSGLVAKATSMGLRGEQAFAIGEIYFLSGAPRSKDSRLRREDFEDLVTTDPALATHVVVTAEKREVPWGLLSFFAEATGVESSKADFDVQTWAAATLVNDSYCIEPLVAVCAPQGVDFDQLSEGSQLRLTKNRGGNWQPGEYGVVTDIADDTAGTCSGYSGLDRLECLLALDSHDTQCGPQSVSFQGDPQQAVTLESGGVNVTIIEDALNVNHGMNTRLGMFPSDIDGWASSDRISIDTNHITGKPYQCDGLTAEVSSETQGLPLADCFADNSCETVSGTVPLEDLETYWEKAHGGSLPAVDFKGEPFESRYDVYLHELVEGLVDPEGSGSTGPRAQCHPVLGETETKPERRVFEAAVVDCSGMTRVNQVDVPVTRYITLFLSEEVDNSEAFVATFDDLVDQTPDDGIDQALPMQGGDVISEGVTGSSYDPYAAQGMKIHALADRRPRLQLDQPPCAVGDRCRFFEKSGGFDLDNKKKADKDALDFLEEIGVTNLNEIALDESNGENSSFDADIGETEGTWNSTEPVQVLTFKAGQNFSVVVYDEPRTEGRWSSEALFPGEPIKEMSNVRAYSFDGEVPESTVTEGRHDGFNFPMLLDSQNGYEEDPDLQSVDMGNVIIIPENEVGSAPDDHARGGMLIFQFDTPTKIESIVFFDGEERDNKVKLYNDKLILEGVASMTDSDQLDDIYEPDLELDVPEIGDGKHRTMYIESHPDYATARNAGAISPDGIQTMIYHMKGSGAIDEITFTNGDTSPNQYDDMTVEFLEVIDDEDSRVITYPVITN